MDLFFFQVADGWIPACLVRTAVCVWYNRVRTAVFAVYSFWYILTLYTDLRNDVHTSTAARKTSREYCQRTGQQAVLGRILTTIPATARVGPSPAATLVLVFLYNTCILRVQQSSLSMLWPFPRAKTTVVRWANIDSCCARQALALQTQPKTRETLFYVFLLPGIQKKRWLFGNNLPFFVRLAPLCTEI